MANNGIMFRFENAGAKAVGAEDVNEALANEAELGSGVEKQLGASEELSQVETGIEQAGEAQKELTEVIDTVEEAAEDGGMTEREAVHLEARIANIARLLGTTPSAMGLSFRRESFGKNQNRLTATKYKLEGLKEWPKKIWEALVKAWNWLAEAVKGFFAGFSKNSEIIEKALKEQETRLKNARNGEFKKKEMSNGAKLFSVEGKTSVETVRTMLGMVETYEEVLSRVENLSSSKIDDLPADSEGFKQFVQKAHDVIGTGSKDKGLRVGNGQALKASPKTEKIGETEVESFTVVTEAMDDKVADGYNAFSLSDLLSINNAAQAANSFLKKMQKHLPRLEKEIDNNIAFCKNQISIASKVGPGDGVDAAAFRAAGDFARAANSCAINIIKVVINKLPSASVTLVKGAKELVDAGYGNIKAEEAKK